MAREVSHMYERQSFGGAIEKLIIDSLRDEPESWHEEDTLLIHSSGLTLDFSDGFIALRSPVLHYCEEQYHEDIWAALNEWRPIKVAILLGHSAIDLREEAQ